MVTKTVTVKLEDGLQARNAAKLVQAASLYASSIAIANGEAKVNAKSIMGVMGLGLANGEDITITSEGPDEAKAAEDIEKFLTLG